jgi:hypothetical protein
VFHLSSQGADDATAWRRPAAAVGRGALACGRPPASRPPSCARPRLRGARTPARTSPTRMSAQLPSRRERAGQDHGRGAHQPGDVEGHGQRGRPPRAGSAAPATSTARTPGDSARPRPRSPASPRRSASRSRRARSAAPGRTARHHPVRDQTRPRNLSPFMTNLLAPRPIWGGRRALSITSEVMAARRGRPPILRA